METKRTRQWRRKQAFRVFKARIVVRTTWMHWTEDECKVYQPHWFQLMDTHWAKVYKTTGTPCSCPLCRGERYKRQDFKRETQRIISESAD